MRHLSPAVRVDARRLRVGTEAVEIPVLAPSHQCPVYPLPPNEPLEAPVKTNFLTTTRELASEQAIQHDGLIDWVRQKH